MARIDLENVSLTFHVRQQRKVTLKEFVTRALFLTSRNPRLTVRALSDVTLSARDGDRVGVIGHNGAGKSTLLKMLAGVYPPTAGARRVEGRVSSMFDISLGFEPDASGWDNIRYRSYLLGETPKSLQPKVQAIAEFSELGDFLDVPVRYYSSGMLVRLAFSISTAINPEILLIDEVLSAGDMAFQAKCQQRMREMMSAARLMVVVTHETATVEQMCNKCVWMQHGRVVMQGKPAAVVAAYRKSMATPADSHHVGGDLGSDADPAEEHEAAELSRAA